MADIHGDLERLDTISVNTSVEIPEDNIGDLDLTQLLNMVKETEQQNEILQTETDMFEKFLKKLDAKELASLGGSSATPGSSQVSSAQDMARSMGRKARRSRGSIAERSLRLTADQKCEIAQKEIDESREDRSRFSLESHKIMDAHKAVLEEADLRITEIRKTVYELEREVQKGSMTERNGRLVGEKLLRFFQEKLRTEDTMCEKLRLKNTNLKQKKRKLDQQLRQKEESGEELHKVDFDQLKIENEQFLEKIEEKNQDLLRLKLMAGSTLQVLNGYKKRLTGFVGSRDRVQSEIGTRRELVHKLEIEARVVEEERAKAEGTNQRLSKTLADYRVPPVINYVKERQDLYELDKAVKIWERKVEIAKMALMMGQKQWQRLKQESEEFIRGHSASVTQGVGRRRGLASSHSAKKERAEAWLPDIGNKGGLVSAELGKM